MPTYVADAIVLKRRDFGEADRLVTIFTSETGKVETIAKGVRRAGARLAGQLEPFALTRLQLIRGRNFDTVVQADALSPHRHISDRLKSTAAAAYLCELFDAVLEERAPQPGLFALLSAALDALDGGRGASGAKPRWAEGEEEAEEPLPNDVDRLLRYVEMAALTELGYAPTLNNCAECGGRLPASGMRFSARLGGLLDDSCSSGAGAMPVQPRVAKLMRLLAYRAAGNSLLPDGRSALELFAHTPVSAEVGAQLARALQDTLEYHLDRRLRSLEFLRGM